MAIRQYTLILFKLPDGRIILQRRTTDAPYAPNMLGIFGGFVEAGESPDECLVREIKEELSVPVESLEIQKLDDFIIPAGEDFPEDRHFFLYDARVPDMDFEVYEGQRAEAYSLEQLRLRTDLTGSAKYVFARLR